MCFGLLYLVNQNLVMKNTHKPLLPLFLITLFICISQNSLAQYPGMGAVRAQQSMQFAQQMQMQMMNMRSVTSSNDEFTFQITMRDSTKKEVTSAIYTDTSTKKHFIVWIDKRYKKSDTNRYNKIYPSQTLSLTCVLIPKDEGNDIQGSYLPGKITDSCWMFKTIDGPINVYCYVIHNERGQVNPSTVVGIQLSNGPILAFTGENLKLMVGQNTRALELIDDKKYIRAIKKYNRDNEKGDK